MASEIKNLVNDMYAKDFSAKAKLSLKQRREEGSYVGGLPPYGYEAYQEGRIRRLRPDRNTAEIVRVIYELFVETENCQAVADWLNKRRINPPSAYRKSGEVYCPPFISDAICPVLLPSAPVSYPSATAMNRTPKNGKIFSM